MRLSEAATRLLRQAGRAVTWRGPRYIAVGVGNLVVGQAVLWLLQFPLPDDRRAEANALSVLICAVPAYYAYRAWVWQRRGRSSIRREVLPFWGFVAVGLTASTFSVAAAEFLWHLVWESVLPRPVTNLASVTATGILWLLRFVWMEYAFAARSRFRLPRLAWLTRLARLARLPKPPGLGRERQPAGDSVVETGS